MGVQSCGIDVSEEIEWCIFVFGMDVWVGDDDAGD